MDSSQRGGESNFRGMGYQKKIIAYFATQMLRGRLPITKILYVNIQMILRFTVSFIFLIIKLNPHNQTHYLSER